MYYQEIKHISLVLDHIYIRAMFEYIIYIYIYNNRDLFHTRNINPEHNIYKDNNTFHSVVSCSSFIYAYTHIIFNP